MSEQDFLDRFKRVDAVVRSEMVKARRRIGTFNAILAGTGEGVMIVGGWQIFQQYPLLALTLLIPPALGVANGIRSIRKEETRLKSNAMQHLLSRNLPS